MSAGEETDEVDISRDEGLMNVMGRDMGQNDVEIGVIKGEADK